MIIACVLGLLVLYAVVAYVRRWTTRPSYAGKTVWITGASSGIGEHLAYEFSRLGAHLILSARSLPELQRVRLACAWPERTAVEPLDMTDYAGVRAATARVVASAEQAGRRVDVLVANAGVSMRCEFEDYAFANHQRMLAVNLHGPVNHIQALLPHFLKQGGGQLVAVSSLAAKLAKAYRSSYAASKHALLGVLDSLRSELAPHNIAVCNILPGYVRTNLSKNALTAHSGESFGRDDDNAQKGMDPADFARQAVAAIYNRENEVLIGREWLPLFAVVLRNLCPDLVFKALQSSAKDKPSAGKRE